jgi:hypothetical protein
MDGLCELDLDGADMESRVLRFLSDRNCDMVTGIRRMGRENFLAYVAEIAEKNGIPVRILPHWKMLEPEAYAILSDDPGADIIYGQDLCHQVPAAVRYNKQNNGFR